MSLTASSTRKIKHEPNWLTGELGETSGYKPTSLLAPAGLKYWSPFGSVSDETTPLQQGDVLKPIYDDIVNNGLEYAYKKYSGDYPWAPTLSSSMGEEDESSTMKQPEKTKHPKTVLIVGAGMAGLSAGYELQRAGHNVVMLESSKNRVGGRVKTFDEKDGFAKGLYVDGGAMRLPCKATEQKPTHYLTDHYVNLFNLKKLSFNNSDSNAFLKFYNMDKITISDWERDPKQHFDNLWEGWDSKWNHPSNKGKTTEIKDIDTYMDRTTQIVMDTLRTRLANPEASPAKVWNNWVVNWSQFPVNGFLRSSLEEVQLKMIGDFGKNGELNGLDCLLPWPEEAITAYSVYTYTEQLDQSLVEFLRDPLGQWWSDNMHHIDGGMSKLPLAFVNEANEGALKTVLYNHTVNEVEFTSYDGIQSVTVKGYYSTSGVPFEVTGDAVLITTPLHIIRQMKIHNSDERTPPLPKEFYKCIEDIWYGPSTKIMIQTKSRFWEKEKITGGFSKTNLPIGQLHYPSNPQQGAKAGSPDQKGILLCYMWKAEALMFGALPEHIAVRVAVDQIATIHPEVESEWEMGAVQAWYNEPTSQGAYCLLKPNQYQNVRELMIRPWENLFFAGEAISFAAGWIQGAIESGLRAAYQFYARNEDKYNKQL